jgi:hypothetical protein
VGPLRRVPLVSLPSILIEEDSGREARRVIFRLNNLNFGLRLESRCEPLFLFVGFRRVPLRSCPLIVLVPSIF